MNPFPLFLLFSAAALLSISAEPASHVHMPAVPGTLSLGEVSRRALADNPSIKAERAKWEMLKQRIPQAAAWDNLLVGADFERAGTTRFGTFSDIEYMAMQMIPVAGKNRSRARIAAAEALAGAEALRRVQLDVAARVRAAYFRLAEAWAQLDLSERNDALLKQFVEITRAKFEVGTQTQADVLTAETEHAKVLEARFDFERLIADAQTQLNVLMNRKPQTPLARPASLKLTDVKLSLDRLQQLALANRPELQLAAHNVTAGKAKVELARREWIPDVAVRVEARQFNGQSGIQEYDTGIFLTVPWGNYSKYKAQEREAGSGVENAQRDLEALQQQALGLVRDQLKKVETFRHHYELYSDSIVPVARQTVAVTQAGYESDKTNFLNLISAQRTLQELESAQVRQLAEHQTALAELEAVIGADLGLFTGANAAREARKERGK